MTPAHKASNPASVIAPPPDELPPTGAGAAATLNAALLLPWRPRLSTTVRFAVTVPGPVVTKVAVDAFVGPENVALPAVIVHW